MSWNLVLEHLFIVLAASLLSILVGVSLGIWAYVSSKTRPVILRVVDLLQTIPSLAMLGIIMVFLGAGKITVIIGITLYSLLPIVRNTCLGLQQVDPGVKEAARGMGMSKPYRILMSSSHWRSRPCSQVFASLLSMPSALRYSRLLWVAEALAASSIAVSAFRICA